MILYTIVPLQSVLDGSENYQPVYSEIPWQDGGTLVVEQCGVHSARVVRLISSNPNDYLDPELQPGNIIEYVAKQKGKPDKGTVPLSGFH